MITKRKSRARLFSVVTSFFMLFSLLTPGFVGAESTGKPYDSLYNTKSLSGDKVSERLTDEFKEQDQVRFLVKFTDTADVMKVAEEAKTQAKNDNLSAYQQQFQKRSSVISSLKTTSLTSQASVKKYLEEEIAKGNAEDLNSFFIVNGLAITATEEVAERIASFPEVEKVLPNETRTLITTDIDEVIPQAQLENVEWNVDRVNAPDVWSMGFDGTGVVVANLDSGVDLNHPALERKYRGYDEDTGEFDHTYSWLDEIEGSSVPTDGHGHGTHVMGTIVGSEEDGSNQVGVAPGAKWIAAKVFNAAGSTNDEVLLNAAEWMTNPGGDVMKAPDVVNNSWGGGPGIDEWYMDSVDAWRALDIFPAFAAGNVDLFNPGGPGSVAVPANYPQSFAVGNTMNDDSLASSSLRGPSPYDEIKPEVSAPGSGIRSSMPGGGYGGMSGTSMATPAVAGVVALLRQVNNNLSVEDIEEILMETARPMTDGEYPETPNNGYGYGIVDAFAAVSSIADGLGTIEGTVTMDGEDTEPPTYEHTAPAESYSGMDLTLTMSASDNVSITSVELHYGDEVIEANQISGDYKSGEFEVTVPGEDLEPGDFTYTWVINDFGDNEVVSEAYTVEIKSGITTGYFEDFESGDPTGWTITGQNSAWEWGEPTSGPGEAYSGDNVYATNLSGEYNASMDATLVMPPIDLPETGDAYIQFQSWHHFEYSASTGRAWDYGQLVISTDLVNWNVLRDFEQERENWAPVEEDLSEYLGERVYIGFYTSSDGSVNREGWYIDDVAISDESIYENDDVPPTFEHEAPSAYYAGMGLTLDVDVFDNLRVGGATLHYQDANDDWVELEAEEINFSETEGTYRVVVPGDDIAGDTFTYKWVVRDYIGNETESEEYNIDLLDPITIGYFEDFEDGAVGWTTLGDLDVWELGEPTSGPGEAFSGDNVYATVLDGEYYNNMDDYLVMPIISLPDGESYLEFQSWHIFEQFSETGTAWDYGQVVVSTDLNQWEALADFTWEHEYWNTAVIDLSEYAGETIALAFYVYSDGSGLREGWYIDDVELTDTPSEDPINTNGSELSTPTNEEIKVKEGEVKSTVTTGNSLMNIPLDATVSVLETDRSTTTDPRDGSFSILHEAGEYTVVAESYGFYSNEESVEVFDDEVTEAHLVLEELPKATVNGTVTNSLSGEPIEDVTLLLKEDANVEPVTTDADGNFDLTAYLGDYTVQAIASDYEVAEVSISLEEDMTVNIELDPFFAVGEDEIYYDDGTPENARAFYDPGNGWGVKMSLPEGKDKAIVTDGVFQFHDEEFPTPGGTAFEVEVWSAGDDGMPDERIAGPVQAEAIRDLAEWTVVDLRSEEIEVSGDFYMVYIQTQPNTGAPGLATDEDGPNAGRSYQYVAGMWESSPAEEGNYMIRARVAYGLDDSEITFPEDGHITNEETITVEGTASPDTRVEVYSNDELAGEVDVGDSGEFAVDTNLEEGENTIGTKTYVDGELAKIGEEITVTLDTIAPELGISSPEDGDITNRETVTVEGTTSDENFSHLEINGKEVTVENDAFSERVMLDEGENIITVSAYDLAGNVTTEEVTVTSSLTAPVIENLEPSQDLELGYGETVTVEFDSEPGLDARFSVLMPLTNLSLSSDNSFEMEEVSEGHYVGTYTVTEVGAAEGALVEVTVTDEFGNETVERAAGKLYLDPTVDRINGDSRYDTAVEISQAGWDSADTVVLTRGDEYADALTGVPLAKQLDAPILLTRTDRLVESTLAEIERLGAKEVVILGGKLAVSESVEEQLLQAGYSIDRIYGQSRYDTAAEIAKRVAPKGTDQVVVANGLDFPDALSVASYAAAADMPILLTRTDSLPSATEVALSDLGVDETIAVGGKLAVSEEVFNTLPNPERLYGQSRYDTNVAIAEGFEVDHKHMYVATGLDFADALTGAVLAAKNDSGLLLVNHTTPAAVEEFIKGRDLSKLTIFGGTLAVEQEIEDQLLELLQ